MFGLFAGLAIGCIVGAALLGAWLLGDKSLFRDK